MELKEGDVVWVRGQVSTLPPAASGVVLVSFPGPAGVQVPAVVLREGDHLRKAKKGGPRNA